jgi:hypothetical protein
MEAFAIFRGYRARGSQLVSKETTCFQIELASGIEAPADRLTPLHLT